MKRVLRVVIYGVFGLAALLVVAGLSYQAIATHLDFKRLSADSTFYRINGKSLHMQCRGDGQPTVVIEPGAGSWSAHWSHIQQRLASDTRVCVYDRTGLGLSEPATAPLTGQQYVEELHALLAAAGEPPPYLLVGHSLGGLLIRLYAAEYPQQVAGMVLADAAHEEQWTRLPEEIGELMTETMAQLKTAATMSRFALLRLTGLPDQQMPTPQQEEFAQSIMMTPRYWNALADEFEAAWSSLPDELRKIDADLGALPLLVITAGRSTETYCATGNDSDADICASAQAAWNDMQRELTRLSTRGRQVVINEATHKLYLDDPDAVAGHIGRFLKTISAISLKGTGENDSLVTRGPG